MIKPLTSYFGSPKVFPLILVVLLSCHSGVHNDVAGGPGLSDSAATGIQGAYSGQFKQGMLTLMINYVSGNTVSGYDMHKGLRRNINGRIEEKDGQYALVLKEPGTNPFDGTFYLSLDMGATKLTGRWVPADSIKTKPAQVSLTRSATIAADSTGVDFYRMNWQGKPGLLNFNEDGSCTLEYYPEKVIADTLVRDSTAQLVTVRGNFQLQGDTIRIEWQNNTHTPALKMKMVRRHVENSDSAVSDELRGNGVLFQFVNAG